MPTKNRGLVWFAVINKGVFVPGFRTEQDKLLQKMLAELEAPADALTGVSPTEGKKAIPELGKASRNDVLYKS